ncbi:MAG: sulfotransferase [Pseudomonadota bacterium]
MRASDNAQYGRLDRTLHRLALGNRMVAEMLFDVDQAITRRKADPPSHAAVAKGRHVFIAGLARGGTTVILRRLHAAGSFRSLTYRDMPFVIAPSLWRRLSRRNGTPATATAERAHGDGLDVNADSPESFDEVFWRVFDGLAYITADRLAPHTPDEEVREAYVRYVAAILASDTTSRQRYLSKNNNNTLRLPALRQAFPNALIVVPFRHPLAHAASLWRQHRQFSELQEADPFVLEYMNWLGHFEFGAGHKGFAETPEELLSGDLPTSIDYWLALWLRVYAFVMRSAPVDAHFVCHEALCVDPMVWECLARAADVPAHQAAAEPFVDKGAPAAPVPSAQLVREAEALYAQLVMRAEACLPHTVYA